MRMGGPGEGVDEVVEVVGGERFGAAAEVALDPVADGLQADRVHRNRLLQLLLGVLLLLLLLLSRDRRRRRREGWC
jgi:hypothetical protein